MNELDEFKKESVYNSQIAAAVSSLAALCYKHGIPMFFSAAVANTDSGGTVFKTEYVSADKVNVTLLDDQLSKHVNVKNGFNTVIPTQLEEIVINE